MVVGKSCHQHHAVVYEDVVCPLEGLRLSDHVNHHTVISEYEGCNDEDCLICHFTIVKVVTVSPTCYTSFLQSVRVCPSLFVTEVLSAERERPQGRAPPFFC